MNQPSPTATQAPTDFVGREPELATLLAGLELARGGRGGLFLVGGEPGIGKSRLADEFTGRARASGAHVLWGRGWEGAGAPPYWPWIQALRAHLRNIEPERARRQLGTGAPDVAQVLPEIRTMVPDLPPVPGDSDSARFQLFDSTSSFLRNMADEQLTLLVLDDLHAADTPSILLLQFLGSQLSDMHLVVMCTYRDVALSPEHPLTAALEEMAREPTTRIIELTGLGEDFVVQFLSEAAGRAPSGRLARDMLRETGGNPLFVKEATRLLLAEGGLERAGSTGGARVAVPAGVRATITRRVHQLTQRTVEALAYAAAIGPEFSIDILRQVAEYSAGDLHAVLDEATVAGLLTDVVGASGRLRFSHDLVRESVYQDQAPSQRAVLHFRIATVLETTYGGSDSAHLAELAYHFAEAAKAGQAGTGADVAARAESYAARAGEQAARSLAYEEAARLLRLALAMLEQRAGDDRDRTELLLAIGDAEARAGEPDAANTSFLAAAEVARLTGEARHLARAALGIGGRLPWARPGNNGHLIPLLEEALMLLGGTDDRLRVRLLARLASAWRSTPEKRQQSDNLSREAVELARRLTDQASLSYALGARYWATWWPDNPEVRQAMVAEMIAVSEELGDPERIVDARLMQWLSHSELGRMAEARRDLEHVRRVAEELRQPAQLWLGVAPRALVALMEGRFELGQRLTDEEMTVQPQTLGRDSVSAALFHRFLLFRERGRSADAEPGARSAVAEFPWYPLHRATLALLLLDLGHADEAREWYEGLAADDFAALYRDSEWLLGVSLTAEACWGLGDAQSAAELYKQLIEYAGRHAIGHAEGSVGAVDRYLGLLAQTMGRLADAERHLEAAIALNEQMGARPWTAHSQHDLAVVLRQRGAEGDEALAAQLDRSALDAALELGMTALAERIGPPVAAPASSETPVAGAVFLREGEYWTLVFDGDEFRLRDAKGLRYLARLLAEPGRELLALDLLGADAGSASMADVEPDLRPAADAGALLDAEAKQAYRTRLSELQAELDEAEGWRDAERADRARAEMDFIARELARAVGLGGRDRTSGSPSERARLSVTRAIRLSMARIAEHSSALGEHLEATVNTGTYCAYRPDPRAPVDWRL